MSQGPWRARGVYLPQLTQRQEMLVAALAEGWHDAQIAQLLCVESVGQRLSEIYRRLETPQSKNPRVWAVLLYLRARQEALDAAA